MGCHWDAQDGVMETFKVLGYLIKESTNKRLRAYFGVDQSFAEGKDRSALIDKLRSVPLRRQSNMMSRIMCRCDTWWTRNRPWLESVPQRKRFFGKKSKESGGLDLYVFTDGAWEDHQPPKPFGGIDEVIQDYNNRMVTHNVDPGTIRICFIRFGNHAVGSKRLRDMIAYTHSMGANRSVSLPLAIEHEC
jgi:hypothetical protein